MFAYNRRLTCEYQETYHSKS